MSETGPANGEAHGGPEQSPAEANNHNSVVINNAAPTTTTTTTSSSSSSITASTSSNNINNTSTNSPNNNNVSTNIPNNSNASNNNVSNNNVSNSNVSNNNNVGHNNISKNEPADHEPAQSRSRAAKSSPAAPVNITSVRHFLRQSAEEHRNARLTIADETVSFLDQMEARVKQTSQLTPSAQLAEVARAVYQYFVRAGLHAAAAELVSECDRKRIALKIPPRYVLRGVDVDDLKKRLLLAFERGEHDKFFSAWAEIHPADQPPLTEEIRVLEFRLQVYFATCPLRRNPPDRADYKERLQVLKHYLELGGGTQLSGNAELVQYFALPYANDPQKHPVFKDLLQKSWAKDLYELLAKVLNNYGRFTEIEAEEEPKIVAWLKAYERQQDPPTNRENLRDYRALQDDFYKVLEVASELVDVLDKQCLGQKVSKEHLNDISSRLVNYTQEAEKRMQKCTMAAKKITSQPMRRNRSLTSKTEPTRKKPLGGSAESVRADAHPADPSSEARLGRAAQAQYPRIPIAELQFARISNQLIKQPSHRGSALLLQALRQQITRAPSLADSNVVLLLFAGKDFLCLRNRKNSVVATICAQTEPSVETKEELGRLLNALASFRNGRNYLLSIAMGKELLYQMALALRTKKLSGVAADQSLACLQKLSIRTVVQKELIMTGMIEWLLQFLDNHPTNFALEFGTALLMNLCLNPVSQSTVLRYKDQLLALMLQLLKHPNLQISPCVNGVLYCMFGFAKIRSTAKEMAFEQILLNKLHKCLNEKNGQQLPVVIKVLKGELESERRKRANDEEDEEEDYLEAEIESSDTLVPTLTELFGETLLQRRYMGHGAVGRSAGCAETPVPGAVPQPAPDQKPAGARNRRPVRRPARPPHLQQHAHQQQPLLPAPPSPPADERVQSVASQATYILENDKRKPLLVPCGLTDAARPPDHKSGPASGAAKRSKSVTPHHVENAAKKVINGAATKDEQQRLARHKSENAVDEEARADRNADSAANRAASSAQLAPARAPQHPNESTPVAGPLQTRIPLDANTDEYVAVFGSRPKVMRTPDQHNLNQSKVFTY